MITPVLAKGCVNNTENMGAIVLVNLNIKGQLFSTSEAFLNFKTTVFYQGKISKDNY